MNPDVMWGLLASMQAAVQAGDMAKARDLGNAAPVQLAAIASELHLGPQISEGAESVVKRGRYKDQEVAVKKMRITTSADLERFRQELVMLASIDHPNVVKLLCAKAVPPDYMLVLPLEAHNLWFMLYEQAWRPSWDVVLSIACQLASALSHVHSLGVVHRDIKPANVLMGYDGHTRLADFGIASWVAELEGSAHTVESLQRSGKPTGGFQKKRMVGTLEYMSPELLMKESAGSCASDVYAFAITMVEIATAMFPFADCSKERPECHTVLEMGYGRLELATAVATEGLRPSLPSKAPPGFNELMNLCWSRNPSSRPTMATVLQGLEACALAVHTSLERTPQILAQPQCSDPSMETKAYAECSSEDDSDASPAVASSMVSAASEMAVARKWSLGSDVLCQQGSVAAGASAGSYEAVGPRESMEDRHIILRDFCGRSDMLLMAVFDGHRGAQAAEFARINLPAILQQCCCVCHSPKEALTVAFQQVDAAYRVCWEADRQERVLKGRRDVLYPGCTAIAALVVGKMLYVANAGDCRAVLCQGRTAKELSRDHTASLGDERERILASGGSVAWMHGSWRIGKSGLQVSRCLGDFDIKGAGVTNVSRCLGDYDVKGAAVTSVLVSRCLGDFDVKGAGVISEPEVTETELSGEDLFLLLASDGLWDEVGSQEAVGLVMDTVKHPDLAAKRVVMESLSRACAHPAAATFYGFHKGLAVQESSSRDEHMDAYLLGF
eukprot:gene19425-26082_t